MYKRIQFELKSGPNSNEKRINTTDEIQIHKK